MNELMLMSQRSPLWTELIYARDFSKIVLESLFSNWYGVVEFINRPFFFSYYVRKASSRLIRVKTMLSLAVSMIISRLPSVHTF